MRRTQVGTELNITSLMDIFTVILIFLIVSNSFGNSSVMETSHLVLPRSISKIEPKNVLRLHISQKGIYVDDKEIIKAKNLKELNQIISNSLKNVKQSILYKTLISRKRVERLVASVSKDKKEAKSIMLLVDKKVPFLLLKNVLLIARVSNYPYFKFGLLRNI